MEDTLQNICKYIIQASETGTVLETILANLKKMKRRYRLSDPTIRKNQLDYVDYCKLKKKYKKIINQGAFGADNCDGSISNKVWICWLQGLDEAPELVHSCIRTAMNVFKDKDIVIITEENLGDYVDLPQYIIDKWRRKIISSAHFTDILRLSLINRYGGTWVDATVYFTSDKLPNCMTSSELFVFSHEYRGNPAVLASNWYISGKSNHPILILTYQLLVEYWKTEKVVINYSFFHLFFTMACERYPDEWQKVHRYTNLAPHILSFEIFNDYDTERFEEIKLMSPLHKLNNRLDGPREKRGTFWYRLINDYKSSSA